MTIQPIRTNADLAAALARVDVLFDAPEGSPEADELDVLATLIGKYEDDRDPIEPPDPVEAIKFRLEQLGRTRADLARLFGSRSRASEILNRKRALTLNNIRVLERELGIPAATLVREYELEA